MENTLKILNGNYEFKVNESKYKYGRGFIALIMIITFFLAHHFISSYLLYLAILLLVAFLLAFLVENKESDKIKYITSNQIGTLVFSAEGIEVKTNSVSKLIDEKSKIGIQFNLNSYFGEIIEYSRYSQIHYGTNNTIEWNDETGSHKFHVFIESIEDYELFQSISDWCFNNKLNTKEFTKGKRTYYGKQLKYAEIQALKDKIGKK